MSAGHTAWVFALLFSVTQVWAWASLRSPRAMESGSLRDRRHHEEMFGSFLSQHSRPYQVGAKEYEERLAIFSKRLAKIDRFNGRSSRTWTAGVNHLTDRTEGELAQLRGWRGAAPKQSSARIEYEATLSHKHRLPEAHSYADSFNSWIRDQNACGSCWAVTATTILSYHSELHASNRTFSTQELVSCVPNPNHCGGDGGCEGATVEAAMQYVMHRGLATPDENPYTATTGQCDSPVQKADMDTFVSFSMDPQIHAAPDNAISRSFGMVGWEKLASNSYRPLINALYDLGPVAISIAANGLVYYSSGIFDCFDVDTSDYDWVVNHAVTLIGYGVDEKEGLKYWLVQNSWGTFWGENGLFRVSRRDDEQAHCGSDDQPQDGVACEGETEAVTVCGTCGVLYDSVVPRFSR